MEARFPIRSLIYASAELRAHSVPVASPDMTAIQFQVDRRSCLAISVYMPPADPRALQATTQLIREAVRVHGTGRELIIAGDFNRHDQLWGGDVVGASPRQGEAQEVLDLIDDLDLHLLLPRGTITYNGPNGNSTIDLIFASRALAEDRLTCEPHATEHGSDHVAINTTFAIDIPRTCSQPRKVLKSADWKRIRTANAREMGAIPSSIEGEEVESSRLD